MQRAIIGYHRDDEGDWIAELVCGHCQHVRHRPPFQLRPWVTDDGGRADRLGTPLACRLCDRAELPEGFRVARSSPEWNEVTMPTGLTRSHRLTSDTWGTIVVYEGQLQLVMSVEPPIDTVLGPGSCQNLPPNAEHRVMPLGPVRFSISFLTRDEKSLTGVDSGLKAPSVASHSGHQNEGGDRSCWAGLLCPDCGSVLDGGVHREGCKEPVLGAIRRRAPQ